MEAKSFLKSFFTKHWEYLAVNTACKLNLFDELNSKKTVKELSAKLNLDEKAVTVLLKSLHNIGFLELSDELYCLNDISILLTEGHPESLKYACMNWGSEHLTAWQNLDYSIKTGKSAFESIYQDSFFNYLCNHSDKLDNYHKAMFEYAKDDYQNLPNLIDFSIHKSVMDVGGGHGATINAIKTKYPSIDYYLFDFPKVVEKASIQDVQKLGGNFFESIPTVTESIILSRILHDWDDEKAKIILNNCFSALPQNGILYVIENCEDRINIDLSLLSLNMMSMCESYERTFEEYVALCEQERFKFQYEKKLNDLQTVMVFEKL